MRRLVAVLVAVGLVSGVGVLSASAQDDFPAVDQPGVTDKEIRVGGVTSKTNPLGGTYASAFDGVEAYFDYINSKGGIYGRDLKLVSKRDDALGNNRSEVQALLSEDDLFAVAPVDVLLFTGADLLADAGIPTFGWNINAEWGSEQAPGAPNLFGEKGSYLCFTCPGPGLPWLAKELKAKKIGVLAYNVPQSSDCSKGIEASFETYPSADVAFIDTSLSFGVSDLSAQVAQMVDEEVDMVTTCMDLNGVLTIAREMKKQGLDAALYLPNGYDHAFVEENAQFLENAYVLTFFTPFESKPKPKGLKLYDKWMKKSGGDRNENSLAGWVNADLLVTGLTAAGPEFTQQKVIDAINQLTDYDAKGIMGPIDWTVQHAGDPALECTALSKVVDGKFEPAFGAPGKPFTCFPNDPPTLPKKPTVQ